MASSPDDAASELNVLVVASAGDPHAEAVIDHLRSRGKTVARLNAPDFISAKIRLSPGHAAVELDGTTWRIGSTTAVWWRRTGQADRPELKDEERRLLHEETRALLTDFLQAAGVRWHDAPGDVDVADRKLTQLASARRQGIRTPDTLVTTDESAAAAFMAGGPTVIKAMSAGEGIAPFVEELVAGDESRVSICPSLLQRRVDAVADLRVVTVGGEAWVWRRARSAGELDWREADHTGAGFVRHPAAGVQAAAVELSGRLGLTITIQDWLETADEPVFLESNAVGGWYFLDGAPDILAPAIAELLIEGPLISDGFWPKLRQRWFYDFLSKDKAPFQDGAKAPLIPRPAWLAQVANRPVAIELERSARIDAESSVQATEAKGDRLLQLSLAVLTLAFLVSGFQLVGSRPLEVVASGPASHCCGDRAADPRSNERRSDRPRRVLQGARSRRADRLRDGRRCDSDSVGRAPRPPAGVLEHD